MEYEFRRNSLDGTLFAEFSMEHAILGRFFAEQLGTDKSQCNDILQQIEQIRASKKADWSWQSNDLSIAIDSEQVRIYTNAIDFDEDFDLEESMNMYDAESEAFCGLEDFESALKSWIEFIARA
ncbi:YacL family protein [Shewanella sp. UCD-KL21]|uniref:YacL family protein n=1 Tax=Shewanella sp. UCD-KL21 TaxID=1917164 RepID=UPI00097068FF|nr:YacL family protein [Shewanella sp. UCD-KL21]